LVPDPNDRIMTGPPAVSGAELAAKTAWSRRVRRVGGFIQVAFAAFWLIRGSLNIGGGIGVALAAVFTAVVAALIAYGIRATTGVAPRPVSPEGKHIERAVTIATVVQLAASFAAPVIVIAAGQSDWLLPSIAVTIGPLLLWLDHRVDVPRYRPAGWTLIVGPLLLIAIMSGTALAATTGIAAGAILLGIATAGFHDLGQARTGRVPGRVVRPDAQRF
jgi:hypothetical protein